SLSPAPFCPGTVTMMAVRIPALLLLVSVSCTITGMGPDPNQPPADVGPESQVLPANLRGGVPLQYVPAIQAIEAAMAEGANDTARQALRALLSRGPTGPTLELARAFKRILDGRERVGWMELTLVATEDAETPGLFQLELLVSQHGTEDLHYRPGGACLWVFQTAIGPAGGEQRGSRRDAVPFPEEVHLAPGAVLHFPVATLALAPPAGVLAFSSRLRLELLPGEFRVPNGAYLPAQAMPEPKLELVRLAGELPNGAIEPKELADYIAEGKIFTPALLERAVRIEPSRRAETLDLLTVLVERANVVDMELLVPALRWLAETNDPGGDPSAWRLYMKRRGQRQGGPERERQGGPERKGGLMLPRR
ncbi:MAG: hypothetical protein ACI9F9_002941, partial [Candidatus Paceibacteria bacterium]